MLTRLRGAAIAIFLACAGLLSLFWFERKLVHDTEVRTRAETKRFADSVISAAEAEKADLRGKADNLRSAIGLLGSSVRFRTDSIIKYVPESGIPVTLSLGVDSNGVKRDTTIDIGSTCRALARDCEELRTANAEYMSVNDSLNTTMMKQQYAWSQDRELSESRWRDSVKAVRSHGVSKKTAATTSAVFALLSYLWGRSHD